jgi:hypothetical protein
MLLAGVEDKILERLKEDGYTAYHIDEKPVLTKEDVADVTAVLYIESGDFTRYSDLSSECELKLVLFVVWAHKPAAGIRKRGLYDTLEGITYSLAFQDFGLRAIDPLTPLGFKRASQREMEIGGVVAYDVEFSTKFVMSRRPDPCELANE